MYVRLKATHLYVRYVDITYLGDLMHKGQTKG